MVTIIYKVDPVKRTIKPMSVHAIAEQDHRADTIRFAFPNSIDPTAEGTIVRVMYIRPDGGDPVAKTLTFYKHSGGYYLYDWTLQKSDLQECGCLVFSLCVLTVSEGVVSEEWHTAPYSLDVLHSIHTDDSDEGDETITPTVAQRVALLESMIQRVTSGAPIVVSSVSDMTDTDQIYVLSTDGNWYYHNGSAWVAGGEYGGVAAGSITTDKLADGAITAAKIASGAVATDTTLTQSGIPADAKAVGDAKSEIRKDFAEIDVELADILDVISTVPAIFTRLQNMHFWTFGQEIVETTGANAINDKACRTAYIQFSEPTVIEIDDDDYIMCAWIYSSESISGAVYSPTESYSNGRILMIPKAETSYFRIGVKRVDGAVLTNDYSDTTSDAYKILNALKTNQFPGIRANLKIACFGDSIMWGRNGAGSGSERVSDTIPSIISKSLGCKCDNFGVGSQGYLASYPADGSVVPAAYDTISSVDLTQYDAMVMCYGVNDGFHPLGDWDSTDETTIMGQFNKILNYVFAQNPKIRLIVFAPFNGKNVGSYPDYWYGPRTHSRGYVSRRILSDTLKTACDYYWIPYIEQYDSPINPFNISSALPDGVHPSADYYKLIGEWFAAKIEIII